MTDATQRHSRPGASWWPLGPLALITYVPLLLTQPGWLSADTKSYLYLDPGRLLGEASSMWDPGTGLGTVSHQSIGYLWPMGPWYWAFDSLGVPDWVAQRLWWGTMLLLAGAGVAYLLRRFGWAAVAIWPAAFAYALSPYVLTHIGRLSGVLLPFVGLPWLLGFTVQAVRRGGWRHPALFALTVATVGSLNLTALALVGLGPLLWLAHALVTRTAPLRRIAAASARIGGLSVAVSAWWIAGLSVQATHGLDVLRYTETADVVTVTTTAPEVLRGLGYWFFYGEDRISYWVPSSHDYMARPTLLLASFALPLLALAGAASARWPQRSFAITLTAVGTFVAVGAHPWEDPTPVGEVIKALLGTERGLAFRSLARVVPLVALGTAMLLGAGVGVVAARWPRWRLLSVLVPILALAALPPLWQGDLVSRQLRFRGAPDYWTELAAAADERDDGTRVLELPGSDFAHYRWGATVDPVTPGLMDRPYAARELVPFGSPASADLLSALDERVQARTLDAAALAPVARLLRAGDLAIRNDLDVARFDLVAPEDVWALVGAAGGLGAPVPFGNVEAGIPPAALVPVDEAPAVLSVQPGTSPVLLSGDGAGIVDAAGAGLLTGRELIRYSASLTPEEVRADLVAGGVLVLTDSNRKAARRWRTVHDTRGFTEPADSGLLRADPTDQRLVVFPEAPAHAQTVVEHRGGMTATATSYGPPDSYDPEGRPAAAVDGTTGTAWLAATRQNPVGERLRITLDEPRSIDRLRLVQELTGASNRTLTAVAVSLDGGPPMRVALDDGSRSDAGQLVTVSEQRASTIDITLLESTRLAEPGDDGDGPVGFASVLVDDDPALVVDEVVRLPEDLLAAAGSAGSSAPLAVVLTRLRSAADGRGGPDEETRLSRSFTLPTARTFTISGQAHGAAADGPPGGCRADLLEIDGTPVPVRVSAARGDEGGELAISSCAPVELGAGPHLLRTPADADVDVDQLVLSAGSGPAAARDDGPRVTVTDDGADRLRARVDGPVAEGDWLVLGQSFNQGWRAQAGGVDLGPPQLLDGFANGWRLPAADGPLDVELRFRPQQRVDLALLVSALSAAVALLLAVRRPRGAAVAGVIDDPPTLAWGRAAHPDTTPSWARTAALTVLAGALGVGLVSPVGGLVAALTALAGCRHRAGRLLVAIAPLLVVGAAVLLVVALQIRDHPRPGLFWPAELEDAHPVAALGIVLLLVSGLVEWAWSRRAGDS